MSTMYYYVLEKRVTFIWDEDDVHYVLEKQVTFIWDEDDVHYVLDSTRCVIFLL